ncbi:AraC family transcriptional regulator [Chitinivorax tropicus]|uniref:AraC family transcriptional regulator n=1 Tax=Chitinivorax tropicus TaxID=714531 RepID=A0A840MJE8_9PROT|nr:AraC family transcriptional regulator [Chitinivorax tropicus]MBB5019324.1 AraC family transcriptional regulator [Chitinivorax tropicus]
MATQNTPIKQYHQGYSQRFNRVLDHIDQHLDQSLDLSQLAAIAYFSPYHFHRMFASCMGETPGDYIRRRRLAVAAFLLSHHPQRSILEIALMVGFGSGEALARAFKSLFGHTPTAWRQGADQHWAEEVVAIRQRAWWQRNFDQVIRNLDQTKLQGIGEDVSSNSQPRKTTMHVTIEHIPQRRVAYIRQIGPYGPAIGALWRNTFEPWLQLNGLTTQTCYGLGHDDPSITPPEKCRYDACVEVPDDFVANGQASIMILPAGRYAVMRFKGTGRDIADAWRALFSEWLPSSGMQVQCDLGPCFERYDRRVERDEATGEFECDLCIPVRPN